MSSLGDTVRLIVLHALQLAQRHRDALSHYPLLIDGDVRRPQARVRQSHVGHVGIVSRLPVHALVVPRLTASQQRETGRLRKRSLSLSANQRNPRHHRDDLLGLALQYL